MTAFLLAWLLLTIPNSPQLYISERVGHTCFASALREAHLEGVSHDGVHCSLCTSLGTFMLKQEVKALKIKLEQKYQSSSMPAPSKHSHLNYTLFRPRQGKSDSVKWLLKQHLLAAASATPCKAEKEALRAVKVAPLRAVFVPNSKFAIHGLSDGMPRFKWDSL